MSGRVIVPRRPQSCDLHSLSDDFGRDVKRKRKYLSKRSASNIYDGETLLVVNPLLRSSLDGLVSRKHDCMSGDGARQDSSETSVEAPSDAFLLSD